MAKTFEKIEATVALSIIIFIVGTGFIILCVRGCRKQQPKGKSLESGQDKSVKEPLIGHKPQTIRSTTNPLTSQCQPKHPLGLSVQAELVAVNEEPSDSGFGTGSFSYETETGINKTPKLSPDSPVLSTETEQLQTVPHILEDKEAKFKLLGTENSENHQNGKGVKLDLRTLMLHDDLEFIDSDEKVQKKTSTDRETAESDTEDIMADNQNKNFPNASEEVEKKGRIYETGFHSEKVSNISHRKKFKNKLQMPGGSRMMGEEVPRSAPVLAGETETASPSTQMNVVSISMRASNSDGSLDMLGSGGQVPGLAVSDNNSSDDDMVSSIKERGCRKDEDLTEVMEGTEGPGSLKQEVTVTGESGQKDQGGATCASDQPSACQSKPTYSRRRSLTPDIEELGRNIPYLEQATMRFPSETHRGEVSHIPVQMQASFELRELLNIQTKETVLAPKEEDNLLLLNADTRIQLPRIFNRFIKKLGTNIPDFIQSVFKSDKWWRIYINIDKGYVEDTWRFLQNQCPEFANKQLIELVEQTSRPEFLSGRNIDGGMLLYALPEDVDLQRVLNEPDYFESVLHKLSVVTLGCFMSGTGRSADCPMQLYGLSVMHLLFKTYEEGKVSVNTVVAVKNEDGSQEVIHFGTEAIGIYGYKKIHSQDRLVDVLVIPVKTEVANDPRLKKMLEIQGQEIEDREGDLEVDIFCGNETTLAGRMIQKKGGRTGMTRGEVKHVQGAMIHDQRLCSGVFVVASRDEDIRPVAIVGDSGSVVREHDEEVVDRKCKAFGLVHKIMKRFHTHEGDLYNLVICVNLYYCIMAIEKLLHCKLEFYKPPVASQVTGSNRRYEIVTESPERPGDTNSRA